MGDSINKDDNDVTAGDIITVCPARRTKEGLCLAFLTVLAATERERAPKD